jgi:Spherulation-specific family 4
VSTYTSTYAGVYGGPPFPQSPLDVMVELDLAGDWTDVTSYALQRDGTSPPITIQRGRPSETSQATPSSANWQLRNQDGRFSPRNPTGPYYGQLAVRNNPVRISVPDSGTYLRFADDAVSYASGPSTGSVEITGTIDIRVDMWLDSYQPCVLASRWSSATSDAGWSWAFTLNGDGTLSFTWYDGSNVSTATSTAALPWLGRVMARAVLTPGDVDDPTATFWTAPDMAGSYSQLGAAVPIGADDFAEEAPGVPLTVGCSQYPAYVASFGIVPPWQFPGGCVGKIYEVQLWGNGTIVADAQFWAQAAGATSFTDPQGNTWTLSGSASLSARSFRAHLECSSLPQQWDQTGTDVWTPVTASGILRRLQQGNSPIWSAMRRAVASNEISDFNPGHQATAYWPCEDPAGSQNIASGLPGGPPMLLSGAPAFQGTAGSASADSLFACSAQLAQIGNSVWYGSIPAYTQANGDQVTFLLGLPSGGIAAAAVLVRLSVTSGHSIDIVAEPSGQLDVNVDGTLAFDGPTGLNGQPVLVQVASQLGDVSVTILPAGAADASYVNSATGVSGNLTRVTVNPSAAAFGETELGHIWFTSTGGGLAGLPGPLAAWAGETAAYRFARICLENSVTCRIYGFPELSAVMGAQEIDTLGNVLQSVEDADRGQMYEPAECLGLGYRTLHSLCAQSPAITLDYTQGVFGGDGSQGLMPTDDDQYTVNDVTLSRNNGSSYQYQVTEGPMSVQEPPDGAGDYSTSLTVYVAWDTQLPHIASWMAAVGTCDEERYPSVPLNLARPQLAALTWTIQDTRIGDYLQITNPPAWLPPGTIDQLVYGVTEKLGGFFWSVTWNAVPEDPYEVAIAGTGASDSAHADTAGSELAEAYDSAATTLSVATTEGPLWTTSSGSGAGQQSIVPLYSYPPSGFWTDVTANAPTMAMIVCNVDSGPGTGYESNFGAVFEAAAAAGITCLGYVPTGYGADSIASVEAMVDLWQAYYGIVSINFDTVSPDEAHLSYYEELVEYVHSRGGVCVLNPGTIPAEGYMSIGADVVCVCEDSQANFASDAAAAPSWLFDYPAASIAVTCNQCSTEAEMVTVVGLASSAFNAHYCWVTADADYGAEPSYFADEVTELGYTPGGGGDFPFGIEVAGEVMQVTDITGSASPQAFTVIRSQNGVVKSQAEGASVALARTPILALA